MDQKAANEQRLVLIDDLIPVRSYSGPRREGAHGSGSICGVFPGHDDDSDPFMTKVFIAGSRQIARLPAEVRSRIDTMVDKGFQILVGDANGADKAVQRYLADKAHERPRALYGEPLPKQCWHLAHVPSRLPSGRSRL